MLSVWERSLALSRTIFSSSSRASHRSSMGARLHRLHSLQMAQSRPLAGSKATLRPGGKYSRLSLAGKGVWQTRHR